MAAEQPQGRDGGRRSEVLEKEEENLAYGEFLEGRTRKRQNISKPWMQSYFQGLKYKCEEMLKVALENNPYAKLLLDAMKNSGCVVYRDRHFSCEACDGTVSGGFDALASQIVLCQNTIQSQSQMNRVVTHELIHAFDHCRAHVDWFNNVKHLACSEIRAANLSGDCSLTNEILRFNFGLKRHHQTCVRDRAVRSILAVRKFSKEIAEKAVDDVFESCFNDHEPFGRVPRSRGDAKYAYRDFRNRDRYYANL
uniref:Mitochondrial inner membrane protease ATP23 n=1 Tax=Salvator merianae TaxID=96440 RepID=A0A8D0CGT9_SALMN